MAKVTPALDIWGKLKLDVSRPFALVKTNGMFHAVKADNLDQIQMSVGCKTGFGSRSYFVDDICFDSPHDDKL